MLAVIIVISVVIIGRGRRSRARLPVLPLGRRPPSFPQLFINTDCFPNFYRFCLLAAAGTVLEEGKGGDGTTGIAGNLWQEHPLYRTQLSFIFFKCTYYNLTYFPFYYILLLVATN